MGSNDEIKAVADYWEGHPQALPEEPPPTIWDVAAYEEALVAWETKFGAEGPPEHPSPPEIPGPPTPGAGMPAARLGDLTAHGGTIGPVVTGVAARVLIGGQPAACMGDPHLCPMFDGPKPHVGGTIAKGSATVVIGNKPAARVSDVTECKGPPGAVALGFAAVLIGDLAATGAAAGGSGASGAPASAGDCQPADEGPNAVAEPRYSDIAPVQNPPGQSTRNAGTGTHWIEIELVDEAEQPVPGEQYLIRLPDGREMSGGLDARGQVRIDGIANPGWCRIKFPNLDLAAWERWHPASGQPQPGVRSAGLSSPGLNGCSHQPCDSVEARPVHAAANGFSQVPMGPRMRNGQWHRVMQGECISSIAKDTGLFWETLWDHPANAELNQQREDPNVLLTGDAVFVPARRPKEDAGSTDQHHKFRRKGEPAWLRIGFKVEEVPRAGEPYMVEIDGRRFEGVLDADGQLQCPIPGNARRGRVILGGDTDRPRIYELVLGELDPVASDSGVQARLNHLGLSAGRVGHPAGPLMRAALERFQSKYGLEVTGDADETTRQRIEAIHGS